jgi:hypothetical protein
LNHLRVLHVAGSPHIHPDVLKHLGESLGSTLETLDLAGTWGLTDAGLAAYVDIEPSAAQGKTPRLAEMERWARARDGRRDEAVMEVPFVTLTTRDAGLHPTLPGPVHRRRTALRHWNLSNCRRVADSGLGALAHAVPNLEVLELAAIGSRLTAPGLVRLFNTTWRIRRVDLEDASIGDAVPEAITPPMADDDPELDSSDEDGETAQIAMRAGPVHLGHAFTHLVLLHCTHITCRSDVSEVARACA